MIEVMIPPLTPEERKWQRVSNTTANTRRKMMENRVSWLCPGSIVVEHLTQNPRIGRANLATDTGREKKAKKF
jgi:hypothetical protein